MKHLILSISETSYSVKRLIEEITIRGDEHEVTNPADLYSFTNSTNGHDRIYKRGVEKSERILSKTFDSIIPRVGGAGFEYACTIIKQLSENMKIFSTGYERGLKICSNKYLTAQVLSKAKIRNPKQVIAHQPSDFKELIDLVGGLPCVGKLQRGSLGVGVMLMETSLAASTSLRSFQSLGIDVILQQYIESGKPANDIRVFVIGPETKEPKIFAFKRYALDNDFRSNLSISGIGEKVTITDEERQMAIDAALAVGLGVCGVDIIRDVNDNDKPYVIEVNGSPGLKGIETVTGENVAGAIIDYIKDNYKKKTTISPAASMPGTGSAANEPPKDNYNKNVTITLVTSMPGAGSVANEPPKDNYKKKTTITPAASMPGTGSAANEPPKENYKKKTTIRPVASMPGAGSAANKPTKATKKRFLWFGSPTSQDISKLSEKEYNKLDARQKYIYEAEKAAEDLI